jgi:hypothetical protein
MLAILVVVAPILFVLLTTLAILSFAPLADETASCMEQDQRPIRSLNETVGAKIILFRPTAPRAAVRPTTNELVAHLERELRQRQQAAQELVADSEKTRAVAS